MTVALADPNELEGWAVLIMAVTGAIVFPVLAFRAKRLSTEVRGMKVVFDSQTPAMTTAAVAAVNAATAAVAAAVDSADKMAAIAAEVTEINDAVNRKKPNEPTLVQRVAYLEETVNTRIVPAIDQLVQAAQERTEWQHQMSAKLGIVIKTGG
jgi:hypothetical protein